MNKQLQVWQLILKNYQNNIPEILLYVLESSGSSPGRQGFFMAVNSNNKMEGSIGGGIMEHKFVEMAKEQLTVMSNGLSEGKIRKQIHDKSAAKNQSGMICSGEQTIFIYKISDTDIPHIKNIITSLEQNKNGTLQLSPSGILFEDAVPLTDFYFDQKKRRRLDLQRKDRLQKSFVYYWWRALCACILKADERHGFLYSSL
jgi:xanthine dehydrogenase accessory factor